MRRVLTGVLVWGMFAVGMSFAAPSAGAVLTSCDAVSWSGDGLIWVAEADGNNRMSISDVGPDPDPGGFSPQWSPEGQRLTWAGDGLIWVADADGNNRISISDVDADPDPTVNVEPQWSPDGSQIVWVGTDGGVQQIWVADADGNNRMSISGVDADPDPFANFSPQWSPDGARIAWYGTLDAANFHIWVADADGNNRMMVSAIGGGEDTSGNGGHPQWSPSSDRIAWSGVSATGLQIWVADADGTNRVTISDVDADPDPIANEQPVWSPDGARIVWSGLVGSTSQIWVADADGNNRMSISDVGPGPDPTANQEPQWSPDATRIAWHGSDGANTEIWVADADGSNRVTVSDVGPDPDPANNRQPQWRPREPDDCSSVELSTTSTELVRGRSATVTVTATTAFLTNTISISGLDLPCLDMTSRNATRGIVGTDGVWTIDSLDGAATATLSGTVTATGPCSSTAVVTGADPPLARQTSLVIGGEATEPPVCPTPGIAVPFNDMDTASVSHRDDIACVYELGVTTGTSATTYSPLDDVTRQQMASFLARLYRSITGTDAPVVAVPFADMDAASFSHRDDIARIYGLGITTGTSPTTYSPLDLVSRQQMASFLARLYAAATGEAAPVVAVPFDDLSTGSATHWNDIARIYGLDITTGTSATTYSPLDNVTRQQMASFLARLYRAA